MVGIVDSGCASALPVVALLGGKSVTRRTGPWLDCLLGAATVISEPAKTTPSRMTREFNVPALISSRQSRRLTYRLFVVRDENSNAAIKKI